MRKLKKLARKIGKKNIARMILYTYQIFGLAITVIAIYISSNITINTTCNNCITIYTIISVLLMVIGLGIFLDGIDCAVKNNL